MCSGVAQLGRRHLSPGILPNSEISTDVWAGSCKNTEEATTHPGWGVLFTGGKKDANQSQVGVLYWRKRPSKGALRWAGWGTEFLVIGRTKHPCASSGVGKLELHLLC